jgi:hypothetical protein
MQGLDRIVEERGGLDQLGYRGFLKMLVTWLVAPKIRTPSKLTLWEGASLQVQP